MFRVSIHFLYTLQKSMTNVSDFERLSTIIKYIKFYVSYLVSSKKHISVHLYKFYPRSIYYESLAIQNVQSQAYILRASGNAKHTITGLYIMRLWQYKTYNHRPIY